MAYRRHRFEQTVERGLNIPWQIEEKIGNDTVYSTVNATVRETITWRSELALVEISNTTFQPLHKPLLIELKPSWVPYDDNSIWDQCQSTPEYIQMNNSLQQQILIGGQDPRLFFTAKGLQFTFYSRLLNDAANCNATKGRIAQASLDVNDVYAKIEMAKQGNFSVIRAPAKFWFHENFKNWVDEKNWMAFETPAGTRYIQNIAPRHVIKPLFGTKLGDEGTQGSFDVRLNVTLAIRPDVVFHGGTNAILIEKANSGSNSSHPSSYPAPDSGPFPRFLAGFHTLDAKGKYLNYLFEFLPDPWPPSFDILEDKG